MPTPVQTSEPAAPARGLALWLVIVVVAIVGIALAYRHGPAMASLLGTRG
ncbi:MAG: hypothetical protein HY275_06780 [Gemmatimonadetes bacterium]|nr:hypothetical protein [Gemmatimonadota bacterium]